MSASVFLPREIVVKTSRSTAAISASAVLAPHRSFINFIGVTAVFFICAFDTITSGKSKLQVWNGPYRAVRHGDSNAVSFLAPGESPAQPGAKFPIKKWEALCFRFL